MVLILLSCIFCACSFILCYSAIMQFIDQLGINFISEKKNPYFKLKCPNGWTKDIFANGVYCINSEYAPLQDDKGNLYDVEHRNIIPK